MQDVAERAQQKRDLKAQLSGLERQDQREIVFEETTPPRQKYTIYSMVNGEPISIPIALLDRTLDKRLPNGDFMFTAIQSDAPEYKLGTVKCFLHIESPEREILEKIGLSGTICTAGHLANAHSRRIHGMHRHSQEWAAFQEHLTTTAAEKSEARQEAQLEATIAMARLAAGPAEPESPVPTCLTCGVTIKGKLKDHTCEDAT